MVVLAASITTRNGKPLLSRQFTDVTKDRVMELLSNFQGLVAKGSSEHTYVEDEHVRYLYKPFDDYYLIIITNRQSNIIQDLSTLSLFSQTMNTYLASFDETDIFENAFEILSSFDEIIVMGYKENLTMAQVETYLTMESHEERIQEIIERNKESEATAERKRRAKEIAKREHDRKMGVPNLDSYAADSARFHGANDPNMANAYNSYYSHASKAAQQSYLQSQHNSISQPQPSSMSGINDMMASSNGGGMKLSAGKPRIGNTSISNISSSARHVSTTRIDDEPKPENNGILICIKETASAQITRDGTITASELKGVLEYRVNKTELAHSKIILDKSIDPKDRNLHFKTHPNIDKNLFNSSNILGLKNKDKAFPSNDHSLGVLRWRKVCGADDKSILPLEVTTWVSASEDTDGLFEVTMEYEINENFNKELNDIKFQIPLYTENISINADNNDSNASIERIDDEEGIVIKVDDLSPGTSGVFGFSIESGIEDSLFPINVNFKHTSQGNDSVTGVSVESVSNSQEEGVDLPFDVITTLRGEEYSIL
ncbi:hypothetical protein TBLA_0E00140 [Henningerozyma blattae CBS 6284]|uniref:Coatomer subunit delta n=1 Tax=Henningerozyma blattae (strain ATCC 34711 / CBS 6284 / DSM 70876 / NBRC 10599 / NRRL Y-10934 / UCD 77-7) TaxID=1071380 RepID=I2H3X5_HENB6|nr:hypothetical protein TBLA_0E00140 [Tetrapisispora blattae CBS 6284]CCH61077.1 hypothetical protein TBLA_0E00140 [Tetrapisispora blattae CBS 6284]